MAKKTRKLKEYHFSCGDSSNGPVGFCAVVRAYTKVEALKKLREAMPEEEELKTYDGSDDVVYFNVYFNEAKVTVKDIDQVDAQEE